MIPRLRTVSTKEVEGASNSLFSCTRALVGYELYFSQISILLATFLPLKEKSSAISGVHTTFARSIEGKSRRSLP